MSDTPEPEREAGDSVFEGAEDRDFALARLMQDQERALHLLLHQTAREDLLGTLFDQDLLAAVDNHRLYQDKDSEVELAEEDGLESVVPSDEEESREASEIDDAEFARRLHLQEQQEHQRRMLEMAGLEVDDEDDSDEDGLQEYFTDDEVDPDDMTYEELQALGEAVGVVSRGVAQPVIEQLPVARYVHPAEPRKQVRKLRGLLHQADCHDEQCVICRMEFEAGDKVKVLPCKHVFHPDCVDQWLHINKACPICAHEVTAPQSGGSKSVESQAEAVPSQCHIAKHA